MKATKTLVSWYNSEGLNDDYRRRTYQCCSCRFNIQHETVLTEMVSASVIRLRCDVALLVCMLYMKIFISDLLFKLIDF